MRKAILLMIVGICLFAGADAYACSDCGTRPDGCSYCYESSYDGAQDCYLLNGEWCTLVFPDTCEGYEERWCPGGRCPDEQEARIPADDHQWQLASVEVIRPTT